MKKSDFTTETQRPKENGTKIKSRIFLSICLLLPCLSVGQLHDSHTSALTAETSTPSTNKTGLGGMQLNSMVTNRPKDAQTEITANDQATFNSQTNIAEFKGSVAVTDPQFTLNCERLRATLSSNRKGLERVEAYGDVLIRQENVNTRGEKIVSLARAEAATYEPATGNITLFKWPQIEQGINRHVSTDKDTKMILNREGRISTIGASKTVIVDQSGNSMQNAW